MTKRGAALYTLSSKYFKLCVSDNRTRQSLDCYEGTVSKEVVNAMER